MFGQRHRADAIADYLAVQSQGAGQHTGLCLQPFAHTAGKLIGIQPDQNLVKHIVTRLSSAKIPGTWMRFGF
jgi:hypothetical protein